MIDVSIVSDLSVGYVDGVGDAVPPAIEQLGASLEFIDSDDLAWGDLERFDVIVTGVRAYERRQDLRANNDRLLQYVENGGTVIVQYNKFEFNQAQYGPYPAQVSRNRVTDERAPIRILENDINLVAPIFFIYLVYFADTAIKPIQYGASLLPKLVYATKIISLSILPIIMTLIMVLVIGY